MTHSETKLVSLLVMSESMMDPTMETGLANQSATQLGFPMVPAKDSMMAISSGSMTETDLVIH